MTVEVSQLVTEPPRPAIYNKFAKGGYIVSKRHRIFKVINTPQYCMLDDKSPAYLLLLIGTEPEYAFKLAKEIVEKDHDVYRQPLKDCNKVVPARYMRDDFILHIASGGVYQIRDLPSECVLEHNRKPAYGYVLPDGRRCFRAQEEVEDQERFARIDKALAAMILLGESETFAV